MLVQSDPGLPDLNSLEQSGNLIFLPLGGGDVRIHARRFAPLGLREFHLCDREIAPETARRRVACRIVNTRPGCRAHLTAKRSLENYLHTDAVFAAGGIQVEITDSVHVPNLVARTIWAAQKKSIAWASVPNRSRRRLREKAKRWLNRDAVERLTPELLQERDPGGELPGWLTDIARLLKDFC